LKFHHLRPGARFEYNGDIYRKVSPLKGSNETDGTQRLIPRSAEIMPLDAGGEAISKMPESLPRTTVESVLDKLASRCVAALDTTDPALDPQQHAALKQAIEIARIDAWDRLITSG
jgi:hypothetical protein